MKPKYTFVRIWGSPTHEGAANNLSITWGWIPSGPHVLRTSHFGIILKINNIQYGFGIYRYIPWGNLNEKASSDNQLSDEVL